MSQKATVVLLASGKRQQQAALAKWASLRTGMRLAEHRA
jgi:hypothetical protein